MIDYLFLFFVVVCLFFLFFLNDYHSYFLYLFEIPTALFPSLKSRVSQRTVASNNPRDSTHQFGQRFVAPEVPRSAQFVGV